MHELAISSFNHIPVLKDSILLVAKLSAGDKAIDCTAGGGGHLELLANAVGPNGFVLGIDQDELAISHLSQKFAEEVTSKKIVLCHSRFSNLRNICESSNLVGKIQFILADIGVSSPQLDLDGRGFSFVREGPLDMRMDQTRQVTAATLVNEWTENDLKKILWSYGEEREAQRIVKAIIKERRATPITTTTQLAKIIENAKSFKKGKKINPATKTFMALRIAVNEELDELSQLTEQALELLLPGGRLAIISFHSLEDRIVKIAFKKFDAPAEKIPRGLPIMDKDLNKNRKAKVVKPFPIVPDEDEIKRNPRSRSAKMRVIQKI